MINKKLTYISLFSSAGVGCYGFKQEGFECVATNELIERRLNVQKVNNKCKYDSGYISGDIQQVVIKNRIFEEIKKWENNGNNDIDLIIATPPCQGMSVANHKKNEKDLQRNSLIVESVDLIKEILPKIFIFENVASFWKTGCTLVDGTVLSIGDMIQKKLSSNYLISKRVINFKNYGSNSSRTRTLVIGVRNDFSEHIVPLELFPDFTEEKKLQDVIGNMKSLEWGEYSKEDFYHSFRTYPERMRKWISNLKEGQSAFDNIEIEKIPHRIINGEIVINQAKNADKYTRQVYNKVAPCIHTRNDQLASQNTVHPKEDRVFSIRELMKMMTIPQEFKWVDYSLEELNSLGVEEKKKVSKKNEINIRQSIGEAVPTNIFNQIAIKIKEALSKTHLKDKEINQLIIEKNLENNKNLKNFLIKNKSYYSMTTILRIVEIANAQRQTHSAYYTNRFIVEHIVEDLPDFDSEEITVLEPSVGAGNFLQLLYKKYEEKKKVNLILMDIDEKVLEVLKILNNAPSNFNVKYIHSDFLEYNFEKEKIDLVIGNPPFTKIKGKYLKKYQKNNVNKTVKNLSAFFLEKALKISKYVSLIMPKNLLNTGEYAETRNFLEKYSIDMIHDFGEIGFTGVLVETINIMINTQLKKQKVIIKSLPKNKILEQKISYITDENLPYWVIYRDKFFDEVFFNMEFDIFEVFRDRQITTKHTSLINKKNYVRVLKSRNISDDGTQILDIPGYDSYIDFDILKSMSVAKFLNNENVYLTPNMTYKPRVRKKEKGYVVNGSIAILIPKYDLQLSQKDQLYFSSEEYREFYKIARNYQTRSLNIDKTSVFWFGRKI